MVSLLAETGFDRAKSPLGLLFVLAVTLFMLLFIFAGAVYMKTQEEHARQLRAQQRADEDAQKKPDKVRPLDD